LVNNVWVGVGIAAEEIAQESLTWGGGFWLFNRVYTPVLIEARLVSARDGRILWSHTAFAESDHEMLKTYPEDARGDKALRLRLTAQKAVRDLLNELNAQAAFQSGDFTWPRGPIRRPGIR